MLFVTFVALLASCSSVYAQPYYAIESYKDFCDTLTSATYLNVGRIPNYCVGEETTFCSNQVSRSVFSGCILSLPAVFPAGTLTLRTCFTGGVTEKLTIEQANACKSGDSFDNDQVCFRKFMIVCSASQVCTRFDWDKCNCDGTPSRASSIPELCESVYTSAPVTRCSAGYAFVSGTCQQCPPGLVSPGTGSCTSCNPGTFPDSNQFQCAVPSATATATATATSSKSATATATATRSTIYTCNKGFM